jgi:hypothetical protein
VDKVLDRRADLSTDYADHTVIGRSSELDRKEFFLDSEKVMKKPFFAMFALLVCMVLASLQLFAGQQKKRDMQTGQPDANVTAEEAAELEAVLTTSQGRNPL